jgi:hypothetical protein
MYQVLTIIALLVVGIGMVFFAGWCAENSTFPVISIFSGMIGTALALIGAFKIYDYLN